MRTEPVNTRPACTRFTAQLLERNPDSATESHALASEFCDSLSGTAPEWIEKLARIGGRVSGSTLEHVDELQRSSP